MNMTILRSMMMTSLRDKISLFYATLFPAGLFVGLGLYIDTPGYAPRLMVGVMALGALFWSMAGQSFQVLQQRNKGVYKLLRVAPLPSLSFIWWMIVARTILGVGMSGLIVLTGVLLFDIRVTAAGLAWSVLLLVAGSLCFTALGFSIANLARNEAQVNMISNLLYVPMVFGSEAFYSLEKAPAWLAAAGKAFPFQYLADGLNRTLVLGEALPLFPLLMLVLFTVIGLLLAVVTFRWEEHQAILGARG
jgi:ABC-2 type transport system permease protein